MQKQKGFTHIEVFLIIVLVFGIGTLIAWRVLDSQVTQSSAASSSLP